MNQLNPLLEKKVPKEIANDDFYQKLSGVFGLVDRDFWSETKWKDLVNSLRREALMAATSDTASHELQIKAIIKAYYESHDPRIIHIAVKFADVLISQQVDEWDDKLVKKQDFFIQNVLRMGYMSLLANAIEKRILHGDIQPLLNKFRESTVYKKNPLLEYRFSFFKEELFSKHEEPVKHDVLGHKVKILGEDNKICTKLKQLCNKTFPGEVGNRKYFSLQRVAKLLDDDQYIAEFSYGYNGGMPDVECEEDKDFDHKWIHYVKQIVTMMQVMYTKGFVRPRLVWIEDPDHSDVYSCYITFCLKKS